MGTGSLQGARRSGRLVDHPLTSDVDVKERVELYPPPLWVFLACYMVNSTFTFIWLVRSVVLFVYIEARPEQHFGLYFQ